jgi:hypothetical protein
MINQPYNSLKAMTCKRCGDSEDRVNGYCSNHCKDLVEVDELREEIALLTKKLAGLENIDEVSAGYRDLAQRAIYFLDANDIYHNSLQKKFEELEG